MLVAQREAAQPADCPRLAHSAFSKACREVLTSARAQVLATLEAREAPGPPPEKVDWGGG